MKKRIQVVLLCMMIVFAAACGGPSKQKVEEVQNVYTELVNRHNEVVEAYADLDDDSLSRKLDEMAVKLNTIGQRDTKDMSDSELDGIIADLHENVAMYDDILASIEEMKGKEKEVYAVPVTLDNNTGVEIYRMYLYKESDTDKGDNLVEDMGYLGGNDTYNVLNIYMSEDEMKWHLEAIDEEGNIIESADIDFTGCGEDGAIIRMEYSFDTMEGWIEMD